MNEVVRDCCLQDTATTKSSGASYEQPLPEDLHERCFTKQDSSNIAKEIESSSENRRRNFDEVAGQTFQDSSDVVPRKKKRERGQNKGRKFTNSRDEIRLCPQIAIGKECTAATAAEGCRFEHSLAIYLSRKPADIGLTCPVFETTDHCDAGYRCRWLSGHVTKANLDDPGTWTLKCSINKSANGHHHNVQNELARTVMISLRKRQYQTPKSDLYLDYLSHLVDDEGLANVEIPDVPIRPVEKRSLDWSQAKVLAPLTTTGNLPFRQICRSYGADVLYSEMAVSSALLAGAAGEWALTRSHTSERQQLLGKSGLYGVQLAGPKPSMNLRAAEVLTEQMSSTLDFIDLNCGCPIDLIFKSGAGSALLDNQGRLLKILRGMSMVSGPVPITCKLRTGVSDKKNTAGKLLARLNSEACVSMVTLHGRSRQQRYSRSADWSYIAECAAQIKSYNSQINEEDLHGMHGEFGYTTKMAFIGNGDIYTYQDWNDHMTSGVDGCMIARGALIKPWIFEEITAQQHIDKSASQRLEMIEQYCKNGLSYWGADQMGVDKTRRFMLEFMSFHHRYTPVGLLESGPLPMNERPPPVHFRNAEERMLASEDCADWIKISEMFLGKAAPEFKFLPKHKANATNTEG